MKIFLYKKRMKSKFRKNGAQWATKLRLTSVGRFCDYLESTNYLKFSSPNWQMSLIGPRRETEIEETLIEVIPNYNIRKHMKPGLSGWAQVNFHMVLLLKTLLQNLVMIYTI